MRTYATGNNNYRRLLRRQDCEVDLSSTSQARRRQRPAMDIVAGGVCAHMLEQYPRQYRRLCRR